MFGHASIGDRDADYCHDDFASCYSLSSREGFPEIGGEPWGSDAGLLYLS